MFGDPDLRMNLVRKICPACSREKQTGHSFCRVCYYQLTRLERFGLWSMIGQGYERNFAAALAHLKSLQKPETPTWLT